MAVEIKVPSLGESVTEVTVAKWLKNLGDMVAEGDPLVELETDKATQEIYAPQSGLLIAVAAPEGSTQAIGAILGRIGGGADVVQKMSNGEAPAGPIVPPVDASHYTKAEPAATGPAAAADEPEESPMQAAVPPPPPSAPPPPPLSPSPAVPEDHQYHEIHPAQHHHELDERDEGEAPKQLPGVERMLAENRLDATDIHGSGRDGRLTKEDILAHVERQNARHSRQASSDPAESERETESEAEHEVETDNAADLATADSMTTTAAPPDGSDSQPEAAIITAPIPVPVRAAEPEPEPEPEPVEREAPVAPVAPTAVPATPPNSAEPSPQITRQKMSRLRQKIAERLKEAQNTAAMLTTFNEVDMTAIMKLRSTLNPAFEAQNGVKLGLMSLFVKAAIEALKEYPAVNAEISGHEILYKNFFDIGVAVGTDRGLVVPVLRGADRLSFAEIEQRIADLGSRARSGKLSLEEMSGGSFTITNGGVYGSLLSTPILNPPQSGILGMHKIQKRPVVVSDETGDSIAIRQMMYLALTYDHRLIDGKEAVGFLVKIKSLLEEPQQMQVQI